jgi:hypothetical protein
MAWIKTAALSRCLLEAERTIATIERCQPQNYPSELDRMMSEWQRGECSAPRFSYARAPRLAELRKALQAVIALNESKGWGAVLAARAAELEQEAQMVEALGSVPFRALARARYRTADRRIADDALRLARQWVASPAAEPSGSRHLSDDANDAESLISQIRRTCSELCIPFRVEVRANMAAAAATGDGIIWVAADRSLSALEGRRIALHEVKGHALPRANAARDPSGVWLVGTAGAADDEEGHALVIEKRAGVLLDSRRHTLALRHLAAEALFDGADYPEVVRALLDLGGSSDVVHAVTTRVFRGGGLGREWVYLPALLRVEAKLTADPNAARWLERGRVSVASIDTLAAIGEPPERIEVS